MKPIQALWQWAGIKPIVVELIQPSWKRDAVPVLEDAFESTMEERKGAVASGLEASGPETNLLEILSIRR